MAASAYHVISVEVENHIFKHNLIFRHLCIYKRPTLTMYWNYNNFIIYLLLSLSTLSPFSSDVVAEELL